MQFEVTNRNIIRSATGSVPVRGGERAANPRPAIRPRGPADTDARPARRNRPGPSASGGSGCGAAPRLGSRPGPFRRVRKPRFRASARACTRPHGNRMQPEIRTCRPSASCRQPAPPGRGVRRSQPPPAGVCGTGGFRRLPSADESSLMRTALPCDAAQCSAFANGGSAPSAAPAVGTRSGTAFAAGPPGAPSGEIP